MMQTPLIRPPSLNLESLIIPHLRKKPAAVLVTVLSMTLLVSFLGLALANLPPSAGLPEHSQRLVEEANEIVSMAPTAFLILHLIPPIWIFLLERLMTEKTMAEKMISLLPSTPTLPLLVAPAPAAARPPLDRVLSAALAERVFFVRQAVKASDKSAPDRVELLQRLSPTPS